MVTRELHDTRRGMQLRLLGHLEASVDDRPVAVGGSKQRAVLAMLGLEANRTVTADRLIEGLWGDDPPPSAPKMVQNYVWRLRKVLADEGGAEILTRGRAYELRMDSELVDVLRLERLVGEAARGVANGDSARQALALFRGDPLADVADEPFAIAEIRRLEELRLTAAELAIDSDLAAGRHHEVVAEVDALLAENPLRERLHAQRLLALYRSGRQAEALEAYRDARDTLVDTIGIEPGPELRRVHAAILRQDPELNVEPAARELAPELESAAAPPLVGRDTELRALQRAWRRAAAGDGGLVAIAGAYGMGKTRIAAELACGSHRDGAAVLYASGSGPPEVALAAIARTRAARRPTVLVLDDADRAPVEVRRALHELSRGQRPALVLATGQEAAALARLEPRESLVLEPLDAGSVRAIAGFYAPAGGEIPVDALLEASRGVARRVHEAASEWARREATRRVDALADRAATGRSDARALARRARRQRRRSAVGARARERLGADAERPGAPIVCPYKGLAPFDRDDAEYFFGREELVADLVAHVVGAPLLAVVGPSGSGKSSVVRAGLLPALAGGVLPGSHGWTQAVIRPGAHPLRELRRATRRFAPHERNVLVVDQFEEVFTACEDERERGEFVAALDAREPRRGRRARRLLRSLRGLPGALAGARRQSRARRGDVARRAAARDRAARAARRPDASSRSSSRRCWRTSRARPVRCRCCRRRCWSSGAGATDAGCSSRPTRASAACRALSRGWPRRRYVELDPDQQAAARTLLLRLSDEDESGAIVRRRIVSASRTPTSSPGSPTAAC